MVTIKGKMQPTPIPRSAPQDQTKEDIRRLLGIPLIEQARKQQKQSK